MKGGYVSMMKFTRVQHSSDITTLNAKQKIELDVEASKEKLNLASTIVSNFLDSIMADTLTNDNPKKIYAYDVESEDHLKEISRSVDDEIYHLFNKNIYAMPDIFSKKISELNSDPKIIIHAPNTVKCITSADNRLEKEITDLLENKAEDLQSRKTVLYTGFEHLSATLPHVYTISRSARVVEILKEKGYNAVWEPISMFLTITIE